MKLMVVFLLFNLIQLSANVYSQSTFKLKERNLSLKEAFNVIESQTNYRFAYRESFIEDNEKMDVKSRNMSVEDFLENVVKKMGYGYLVLEDNLVIITAKDDKLLKQELTIKGKVTDIDGNPLPGVNIVEKGTTNGAISNLDGEYNIAVASPGAMLSFSYVGFLTEEIEVGGQATVDVVLIEDIQSLEEVVVIGYGSVKKADLTGAVGLVEGDAIAERQATQVSQALQGSIPGIMVTRDNNAPGSTATIRIRGITTIGNTDPLIIVDGVPVGNINDVNPNDIQSISVLKDAASAAIYGARAAAGVILVTTKRAKSGQLSLTYNTHFGFEKPTTLPDYVDVTRFMEFDNEMRWNDNANQGTEYSTYPEEVIDNYMALNAENPDMYPNTDWMGLILKSNAPKQSHVLSATAGTESIKTKASLAYDKIDALYDGRTYERLTARFNNDATINRFLSASFDFYVKRTITKQPIVDPMYRALISAPVYAAQWSDGRVAEGKSGANIYGQYKYGGFSNNWYNTLGGKASIDFTPVEGLKISAIVSPSLYIHKGKNFNKRVPYYAADDPTLIEGTLEGKATTDLVEVRNDNNSTTTQFLVNYIKSFLSHNLNVMAGYENFHSFTEELKGSRNQYILASFPYLNLGPLEYRGNSGIAWENAYRSWFGRIMYNYKNKYFLQGNVRYDASSRFYKDYRWGSFPSFSAGWVVSEEQFMTNIDALSFLKLRGSWGALGNERIGNYPYQATIEFNNALFYQGNDVVSAQTAAQIDYAIQNISWEKTESYDFGLDANFFDNRLRFTGDYYAKTTKDMLLQLEIPDYTGFENPDQNTGKMETKGWEIEIGWQDNINELHYSLSLNISNFKSVMGDLGGTEFLGDKIKIEGSEFNEWYGYKSNGLYQTQEEVDNSATLNNTVRAGDVKYVDISGPDGEPDGIISPEYDRVLLGGSLPEYLYGGNLHLDYKGFDFAMVVQGVGKQKSRLEDTMIRPLLENWGHVPAIVDGNYWSHYNTPEQNLGATYPRLSWTTAGNNYVMSDFWLFSGAYLRMKNITLGYTIPNQIIQKLRIKDLRIYSSISDLFTIDNYPKGWDPEVARTGYPITTSYVFGISVNF